MGSFLTALIILAGVAAPAAALAAGQACSPCPLSTIAGARPYLLGAASKAVLAADPYLQPGARRAWTGPLRTETYSRSVLAPIGGFPYAAELAVQFYRGRLAAVTVSWPSYAFGREEAWSEGASALIAQVLRAYEARLVRQHATSRRTGGYLELGDARGNLLIVEAPRNEYTLTLAYLWAPYARGPDRPARPQGRP